LKITLSGSENFPEDQFMISDRIIIEDSGLLFISMLAVKGPGNLIGRPGGSLDEQEAGLASLHLFFGLVEKNGSGPPIPGGGMDGDPVDIVDGVGQGSLAIADISEDLSFRSLGDPENVIFLSLLAKPQVYELQSDLHFFGLKMRLGSENGFKPAPISPVDFADFQGNLQGPSFRMSTSSNLEKSTEGVTSMY
jgi:hypothetical protein